MSRLSNIVRSAGRGIGGASRALIRLPRRTARAARGRPRTTLVSLGATAVVLAGATAVFAFLAVRNAQVDEARTAALGAAGQSVVTLLSYDYRSIGDDQASREQVITGQFKNDYASLIKDVVGPSATQQQLTTRTTVVSSSVAGNDGTNQVTLLMFLNQTSQSSAKPDPVLSGSRVRVTMQNVDNRWLVSELTPV